MESINVKIKKLDDRAVIPTYAHYGDVGMDFTCIDVEYDEDKDLYIYHTGLAFESDFNYGQFLFPRSSNRKTDAYLCNGVGIADSAIYRGEIMFCYKNRDSIKTVILNECLNKITDCKDFYDFSKLMTKTTEDVMNKCRNLEYSPYKVGDKIGQMVFIETPTVYLIDCDELSETERGANGFGSTGN